jgi:hypothetical protein
MESSSTSKRKRVGTVQRDERFHRRMSDLEAAANRVAAFNRLDAKLMRSIILSTRVVLLDAPDAVGRLKAALSALNAGYRPHNAWWAQLDEQLDAAGPLPDDRRMPTDSAPRASVISLAAWRATRGR